MSELLVWLSQNNCRELLPRHSLYLHHSLPHTFRHAECCTCPALNTSSATISPCLCLLCLRLWSFWHRTSGVVSRRFSALDWWGGKKKKDASAFNRFEATGFLFALKGWTMTHLSQRLGVSVFEEGFVFFLLWRVHAAGHLSPRLSQTASVDPAAFWIQHRSFSFRGIVSYNNHLNPQLQAVLTCSSVTTAAQRFSREELGALQSSYISWGRWVRVLISASVPSFCGCHDTTRLQFCTIWCFLLVTVEAVHFQSHDPTTTTSSSANVFVCLILFLWSLLKHPLNYKCWVLFVQTCL